VRIISELADRLLARVAPKVDASAGCTYQWYTCACVYGTLYAKRCMYGCSGVPNHCYSCVAHRSC
jgi:hypothetical protein